MREHWTPVKTGDEEYRRSEHHGSPSQLRETEGVAFCADAESADTVLAAWAADPSNPLPARLWSDAWLAATAEAAGLRRVSFDADFKHFALTRSLILPV